MRGASQRESEDATSPVSLADRVRQARRKPDRVPPSTPRGREAGENPALSRNGNWEWLRKRLPSVRSPDTRHRRLFALEAREEA